MAPLSAAILRHYSLPAIAVLAIVVVAPLAAHAQLRIATYNPTGSPEPGMEIVLRAIGEQTRNDVGKPIDVLLLQEQSNPSPGANSPSPTTQQFVTLLNNLYSGQGITYAMGNRTGNGDSTQSIIYRMQTIQLLTEITVGTASGSGQPRQTLRYRLRPVGYDPTADFYIYNSHYKASQASDEPNAPARRNVEATAIRTNANALGDGIHIIYAGDFNLYDYTQEVEPAFQTLVASGNGQAHDPINSVGTWHNNPSFAAVHTQSPCLSGCGAGGGMDDRFDFQLVTGEFLDGEGLSYISGSYHAFGNNGSTYNDDINDSGNTYVFSGVTSHTKSQILNALHSVTDHIPVVADYQLPAVMQAVAGAVPATLMLDEVFELGVTVSNAANVVAAIGADELDYSLTTSGALSGSFLNQIDMALGGGNTHFVTLDTSTPGMKSGMITISSTSQQVQNGLINIPVSFEVLAALLAGDYNRDAAVDAADYVVWRHTLGQNVTSGSGADGNGNGMIDPDDYTIWRANFGRFTGSSAAAGALARSAIPEPGTAVLMMMAVCLASLAGGTLRIWTRKS